VAVSDEYAGVQFVILRVRTAYWYGRF